jgi:hypothetical protein
VKLKRAATEPGLWHYTVVEYLPAIPASGEIRLATRLVSPGVKPAVWCSTNAVWEETANKMLGTPRGVTMLDRAGTHEHFGLARISVRSDAAPHTWADYQRLSGEDRADCRRLERVARKVGAWPAQWRCSFAPILAEDWLAIEAWDGSAWHTIATPEKSAKGSAP